ncbi:MAG: hypothetical protein FWD71_07505 [Oscillospiraceae bacterium]|nr:hypothetical protein [Oscillospiraceae bacterium]
MKRLFFLMLISILFLQGCQFIELSKEETVQDTKPNSAISIKLINNLTIDHITEIKVTPTLPLFDEVHITDFGNIESIANYFNSINLFDTKKDSKVYGMGYRIEFLYDDNTTNKVLLFGNMFIDVDDKPTQELSYEEASYFNVIIGDIILNQYRAINMDNIISGEILSVSADESGHNTNCEIKTDDNTVVTVDVNNSKIIDITGSGWLILHVGDKAEIGLKDKQNFIADTVFITKTNK